MEDTNSASPVETTGASADAAAPVVAPEASGRPGRTSRASQVIAEAEEAAVSELAEIREELSRAEQVVMSWCNQHFSNSPVSRATEALNYLRQHAVPDLLNRIREI